THGNCRHASSGFTNRSTQLISIHLLHDDRASRCQMLPNTEPDVTVIGIHHLELLWIPRTSLLPLPAAIALTTNGSQMSLGLGCFKGTLKICNKSSIAKIQVHKGIQTPLLSFAHCQLSIILSDFPKPILAATHVNRCAEMTLPATTSPSAARNPFLPEFGDVVLSMADLQQPHSRIWSGLLMKIHHKDDAVPFTIHTLWSIPIPSQSQVKEELDSMVNHGIIEPDQPSEWCQPWSWWLNSYT
ncbi:hypothetical protein SK128_017734, partial [Halocaridina rubra]